MSLRKKVIKGVVWSTTHTWGTRTISFFIFFVLARFLEPKAFGLVALASVFINFVEVLLDQGFNDAIVQNDKLEDKHLDTAFWTNVVIGGLLAGGSIAASGLVANLFDEPELAPIVSWLSLTYLFGSLNSAQVAILRRKLAFKQLAMRSLIAALAGGLVGVTMAVLGFGVWSLVAQMLVKSLVQVIVLWQVSDWRPGFHFSVEHFKGLFSFGINIVGIKFLEVFNRHSDDLLIGYFLGPIALGYYTIAYRIFLLTTNLLVGVISNVAFPAFSRLQAEPERMRRAYYTATQLISLVAFPGFLGMSVLAPELVFAIYGPKWASTAPVMQILSLGGIFWAVFAADRALTLAAGKPSWRLGILLVQVITGIILFYIAVQWGIVAVAAAFVLRGVLVAPLSLWVNYKLVRFKLLTYLSQYVAPVIGSLIMVAIVLWTKQIFASLMNLYALLAVEVVLGAGIYGLTILLIAPSLYRRILTLAQSALPDPMWRLVTWKKV